MLVAGQTFCLTDQNGCAHPSSPHGLFVGDTRVLSGLHITVDGGPIEALGVAQETGSTATFAGRPGAREDTRRLLVIRRRSLEPSLTEHLELRNHHREAVTCELRLEFAADFADLFAVKEGRARAHGHQTVEVKGRSIRFGWELGEVRRETVIKVDAADDAGDTTLDAGGVTWVTTVPGRSVTAIDWVVSVAFGGEWVGRSLGPLTALGSPASQMAWVQDAPEIDTDHGALARAFRQAIVGLGSLRLFDPLGRRLPVVAAGAPWFMTLFGRDALWASWMALPADPTLGLGVLDALAELQGEDINARTEEEPGRIMHETRFEGANTLALEGGTTYYGSVDATPLFVCVLGELARWGLPEEHVRRLLPHADRALAWVEDYGDRDGDGYLEYQRATPHGLANQGWKDSWDAIRHRDGSIAEAPIALCEVQGYVYAAYRARAELAERFGDVQRAARWRRKAAALKQSFNDDFWIDELGWFAIGLDRSKRPVGALASNMGHCMWAGIVDDDRAAEAVERLGAPAMWTGWGLRTLASTEVAYDPVSYHCGSVWPHDSAINIAGIARYGFREMTFNMVDGLLAAADRSDGRLPELFLGLSRDDVPSPVAYPTSCSPQAWSAASPLLLLRVLLGLAPDVPGGEVRIQPALPPTTSTLELRGLRLWDTRFDIICRNGTVEVRGLPQGVKAHVVPAAR
jgi:glycogen debranching enzyme